MPDGEQTRLVNPVMLAGTVTADHASTPVPEIVSDSTAAPLAVVPMATQLTADGHTIWDSEVTPVRAVPVLAAATDGTDGLASTITGVLTPPVSWYPTPSHSTVPAQAMEAMRVAATGTLTVDQLAWLDQLSTAPALFSPAERQVICPAFGHAVPSSTALEEGYESAAELPWS